MRRVLTIVLVVVLPCAATAATLRVPSQYAEIQAAIDASSNGDTILVGPGTYQCTIGNDIIGKAIHVVSEGGPEVTTIANRPEYPGWESGSYAFYIESAPGACTISGFTMWGHSVGDMTSNHTIQIRNSDVKVVGNRFTENVNLDVVGIEGNSSSVIEYNIFYGNRGTSVHVYEGASPTIRWNTCVGNTITFYGDIEVEGNNSHPVIRNNIIVNAVCIQPPPHCYYTYGVHAYSPPENIIFECNDVWNNPSGNYSGTLSDQTGINGNISVDPLFCGVAGSANFYLQSSSPCASQNVPGGCSGQGMGCYPATCTVAVKQQSWGSIKSLFENQKK
jgi:hypothetical protein